MDKIITIPEVESNHIKLCMLDCIHPVPAVTTLHLTPNFNSSVDNLPGTLEALVVGDTFNQSVDRLPNSLKQLTLAKSFCHPLDHLPVNLKDLNAAAVEGYTLPIRSLPTSLHHLSLPKNYNQPFSLPLFLLSLNGQEVQFSSFPPSLSSLSIAGACLKAIPPSLTRLTIFGKFPALPSLPLSCFISAPNPPELVSLPQQLKFLVVSRRINVEELKLLPTFSSLTYLRFLALNQPFPPLPSSLEEIQVDIYNHPLVNLPPGLKVLKLANEFNHNVDHLPPTLHTLHLGHNFNQPVDSLPLQLRKFGVANTNFHQKLDKLPLTLVQVYLIRVSQELLQTIPPVLQPVVVVRKSELWGYNTLFNF